MHSLCSALLSALLLYSVFSPQSSLSTLSFSLALPLILSATACLSAYIRFQFPRLQSIEPCFQRKIFVPSFTRPLALPRCSHYHQFIWFLALCLCLYLMPRRCVPLLSPLPATFSILCPLQCLLFNLPTISWIYWAHPQLLNSNLFWCGNWQSDRFESIEARTGFISRLWVNQSVTSGYSQMHPTWKHLLGRPHFAETSKSKPCRCSKTLIL